MTSLQKSYVGFDIHPFIKLTLYYQYNHSADLMSIPISQLSAWTLASNLTQVTSESSNSTAGFMSSLPDYLGFTEPYFSLLGSEVRLYMAQVQSTWIRLALGSGPTNRVFAVSLGYTVVCLIFSLYLNILTVGNARNAGIVVRNAVRQQLLVLKVYSLSILIFSLSADSLFPLQVATFIFIELVTFPLGCGIVLDLCTVWLFPEANMQSRATFFVQAPLTAMFYHWVAGTMFMLVPSFTFHIAIAHYSMFSLIGTLLLYFYLAAEVLCAQVLCGSSRILKIKTRILFETFLIVQHLYNYERSASVG